MGDFVLYKEDIDRINKILSNLITESASAYVLLINKDGNLISQVGFSPNINVTSLAALAAGSFASTKAIATLIGETEFSVMFHQGDNQNIHISLVDEDVIMVLIFDDRTNLGLVKMIANQAKAKLGMVLKDVKNNGVPDVMPELMGGHGGEQVQDRLDLLFPGDK
jgi:predicted regulator of Ras-like GTPase activity (Roadblock/LC7/MglB family)